VVPHTSIVNHILKKKLYNPPSGKIYNNYNTGIKFFFGDLIYTLKG